MQIITIDGNDGTGKSTLVMKLRDYFGERNDILIKDRGIASDLTDDLSIKIPNDEFVIILDCPVEVSRERLAKAGKDLTEKYHTIEDLEYYRNRFLLVAQKLKPNCIVINSADNSSTEDDELFNKVKELLRKYLVI